MPLEVYKLRSGLIEHPETRLPDTKSQICVRVVRRSVTFIETAELPSNQWGSDRRGGTIVHFPAEIQMRFIGILAATEVPTGSVGPC